MTQLTPEQLDQKIEALKQEIVAYGRTAQAEINGIQQALQNKIREAQKTIDNKEGALATLIELRGKDPEEKPSGVPAATSETPPSE